MDRAALSTLSLQQLLHLLLTVIHEVCNRLRIASLGLPCGSMRRFKLREGGWGLLPIYRKGSLAVGLAIANSENLFSDILFWEPLFQFCNLKHLLRHSLDFCGEFQFYTCWFGACSFLLQFSDVGQHFTCGNNATTLQCTSSSTSWRSQNDVNIHAALAEKFFGYPPYPPCLGGRAADTRILQPVLRFHFNTASVLRPFGWCSHFCSQWIGADTFSVDLYDGTLRRHLRNQRVGQTCVASTIAQEKNQCFSDQQFILFRCHLLHSRFSCFSLAIRLQFDAVMFVGWQFAFQFQISVYHWRFVWCLCHSLVSVSVWIFGVTQLYPSSLSPF